MSLYDSPEFFSAYAQMSRSREGLSGAGEWTQLRALFPDVQGLRVLDLGCGYGWHCRYAAEMGASAVTGIDASARMIAEAQSRTAHPRIAYSVCDLTVYEYHPAAFDLVVSNLVLHYVEDLDAVYQHIHRALTPGGVFLMNIEHPTFTAGVRQCFASDGTWPVTDYFLPGERQTEFLGHSIVKQHHTLTQILNGLLKTGFVLEAVEEAMPPEEWQSAMPEEMRRPMMLLVRARKA